MHFGLFVLFCFYIIFNIHRMAVEGRFELYYKWSEKLYHFKMHHLLAMRILQYIP